MHAAPRVKTGPSFKGIDDMPAIEDVFSLARPKIFTGVWAALRRVLHRFRAMRETAAGRRALAGMDGRMLADIGASQSEAAFEMNRKFWDTAPSPREPSR